MNRQPGGEEIAAGCLVLTLFLLVNAALFVGLIWAAVWVLRWLGVLAG